MTIQGRVPRGTRGLKLIYNYSYLTICKSRPAWDAGIETTTSRRMQRPGPVASRVGRGD